MDNGQVVFVKFVNVGLKEEKRNGAGGESSSGSSGRSRRN